MRRTHDLQTAEREARPTRARANPAAAATANPLLQGAPARAALAALSPPFASLANDRRRGELLRNLQSTMGNAAVARMLATHGTGGLVQRQGVATADAAEHEVADAGGSFVPTGLQPTELEQLWYETVYVPLERAYAFSVGVPGEIQPRLEKTLDSLDKALAALAGWSNSAQARYDDDLAGGIAAVASASTAMRAEVVVAMDKPTDVTALSGRLDPDNNPLVAKVYDLFHWTKGWMAPANNGQR